MELLKFVSLFKEQTILIVCDAIVDKFVFGKIKRISPETFIQIVDITEETERLEVAVNVANNVITF